MRYFLLLLLTTLVLTACGGDTIAAGGETIAAGGTDGPAVADTPPPRSSETKNLEISCHFAARQLRVTCTAVGYTEGARLYWWTNSEPAEAEGAKFDFAVTKPVPNLTVSFEECNSGKCQTVTTTLDTTKAAATVVIKPGQVVQIPMAPAINPDGSPKTSKPQAPRPTVTEQKKTGLAIDCQLNDDERKVTCTASGYTDGARLYWWTNSEPAEAEGAKFDFAVTNPVPDLTVSFEECNSGSCQTVTTTLDTSAPATLATSASTNPTQTIPDAAPTFKVLTQYAAFPNDVKKAFQSSVDTHFKAATEKAGVSVAVYQDGRLWEYATGNAQSSTPMTVNTPMLIRSVSKTLIAPLILKQVETGSYKLSDTISKVLDGHPAHNLINSNFINPEVTVAQLLHMRSGLSDYGEDKDANYTFVQTSASWEPIALLHLVRTPYQSPGDYWYSNTNTLLLGLIAEHHGDQPLNRLLKQTFFDPLEISAGLLPQDAAPVNTARPHGDRRIWGGEGFGDLSELTTSWLDDWVLQTNRTTWIGGGVVTTAGI